MSGAQVRSLNAKALAVVFGLGAILGAAIGAGAVLSFDRDDGVRTLEGEITAVNYTGEAIGFDAYDGPAGEGYSVAGAMWKDWRSGWHTGADPETGNPTCLEPLSSGQRVRLGVMDVPQSDGPGRPVVVWIECLTEPTERWAALPQ